VIKLRQGKVVLFSKMSKLVLGPTEASIQWVPGAYLPRVNQSDCKTECLPPFSVKVKNERSNTSSPTM
jgi:hypothetical protein